MFFILGLAAAEINRRPRKPRGKNYIFLKSDTYYHLLVHKRKVDSCQVSRFRENNDGFSILFLFSTGIISAEPNGTIHGQPRMEECGKIRGNTYIC